MKKFIILGLLIVTVATSGNSSHTGHDIPQIEEKNTAKNDSCYMTEKNECCMMKTNNTAQEKEKSPSQKKKI